MKAAYVLHWARVLVPTRTCTRFHLPGAAFSCPLRDRRMPFSCNASCSRWCSSWLHRAPSAARVLALLAVVSQLAWVQVLPSDRRSKRTDSAGEERAREDRREPDTEVPREAGDSAIEASAATVDDDVSDRTEKGPVLLEARCESDGRVDGDTIGDASASPSVGDTIVGVYPSSRGVTTDAGVDVATEADS